MISSIGPVNPRILYQFHWLYRNYTRTTQCVLFIDMFYFSFKNHENIDINWYSKKFPCNLFITVKMVCFRCASPRKKKPSKICWSLEYSPSNTFVNNELTTKTNREINVLFAKLCVCFILSNDVYFNVDIYKIKTVYLFIYLFLSFAIVYSGAERDKNKN